MKQFSAIGFSLLLIAAQTFAVNGPVSGGSALAKRSCCDEDCQCDVSPSGAPSVPPVESTAPVAAQNQFVLPPVLAVVFTVAPSADESSPASALAEFRPATAPIFARNCSFLI